MTRLDTGYQIAKHRAALLWKHCKYARLNMADVFELTGVPWDGLYKSFEFHGIEAPIIYDTTAEKVRRKALSLTAEAQRLDQAELTKKQAARLLGIDPSRVSGVMTQIAKRGFSAPPIIQIPQIISSSTVVVFDTPFFRMAGRIDPWNYPAGLQVLCVRRGPGDNQLTYLLR